VERIKAIAQRHGVSVKAAALQFALANPAVAAVIPGASRPERIAEDHAALNEKPSAAFWQEMREQNLVGRRAAALRRERSKNMASTIASIKLPVSAGRVATDRRLQCAPTGCLTFRTVS
jgi:diketogulonate reductase-like aldo/keto reductase